MCMHQPFMHVHAFTYENICVQKNLIRTFACACTYAYMCVCVCVCVCVCACVCACIQVSPKDLEVFTDFVFKECTDDTEAKKRLAALFAIVGRSMCVCVCVNYQLC